MTMVEGIRRIARLLLAAAVLLAAGCAPRLINGRGTPEAYEVEYWRCSDTIDQAKREGVDYVRTVEHALRGDCEALRALFRLEGLDGAGGESHAAVLGALLDTLGDRFFAGVVAGETPEVKGRVAADLAYDLGLVDEESEVHDELAKKRPLTCAALFTVEERVRFLVESCRREVHGHQRHCEVAALGPAAVPALLAMLDDERKVWVRIGPPQGGPESRHVDVKYLLADDEGPRSSVAEFALLCICEIRSPKVGHDEDFRAIYGPVMREFTDYDGKVSREAREAARKWWAATRSAAEGVSR